MKRILALVLCVLMCATMVPLFASCGNKNKEIDLSDAQIVYADNLNKLSVKKINNMKKTISDSTGATVGAYAESKVTEEKTFEILVGNTTRPETEKALKKLKDAQGYTVQVIKNKLVIVGTNDALTYVALQEFEKTYFSENTGNSVLSLPSVHMDTDSPLLELVTDGKFGYTVVYSKEWDDNSSESRDQEDGAQKVPTDTLDVVDYQYRQVANLIKSLNSSVGVKPSSSNDKKAGKDNEILVGQTTRSETAAALAMINEQQYIVTTINGKIVAAAWNDQGVKLAAEKLAEIIGDCVVKTDAGTTVTYPAELTFIGTYDSKWVTDFPKPTGEGVNLIGTMDVSDGQVEYCYTGTGVTMDAYNAYAAQLTGEGYTVFSDKSVEGSRFTTFNNSQTDVSLHVTFSAYAHASDSSSREPTLRVISARLSKLTQPDVTPNFNYTKVFTDENVGADTGALICQMYLRREESNNFGNCFVTMLEDGSFILYDGGGAGVNTGSYVYPFQSELVDTQDHLRIIETMRDLRKLVNPSASGPVTLAAWIMSHGHWDHVAGFQRFCRDNGNQVIFERAYANFPSVYETFNSYNPGSDISILEKAMDQTQGDTKYVKMHTGQTFWVRNAEIEVIYTHEDLYPERVDYYNSLSTVYRVHYHVTDGRGNLDDGENGAVTCMWLGDAQTLASNIMSDTYGDYLKSDMVQLAHHGYQGCETRLYGQIRPELVWWPVWGYDYISQVYNPSSKGDYITVDRYVANTLDSVKWIIVAGAISSDSLSGYISDEMFSKNPETGNFNYQDLRHDYTLRVTKNGIDGDKLYCANEDPKLPVGSTAKDAFNTKAPAHGAGYN